MTPTQARALLELSKAGYDVGQRTNLRAGLEAIEVELRCLAMARGQRVEVDVAATDHITIYVDRASIGPMSREQAEYFVRCLGMPKKLPEEPILGSRW